MVYQNIDRKLVESLGHEWEKFYNFTDANINIPGKDYYGFLSDAVLNKEICMLDMVSV